MEGSQSDDANEGLRIAKEWAENKGYTMERYSFGVSDVQSCPPGIIMPFTIKITMTMTMTMTFFFLVRVHHHRCEP